MVFSFRHSTSDDVRRLIFSFFFLLSLVTTAAAADSHPYQASEAYDSGELGEFPRLELVSRPDLYAPRVNVLQNSSLCSTANAAAREYTFIAPRGNFAVPAPVILDDDGELVWTGGNAHGMVYDFKPQRLFGEDVLTYWAGDDMVRGHGSGEYHVLDTSYKETHTFRAGNGLDGDLHEFLILENNTAVLTVYHIQLADLSSIGGPSEGEIWESIFQEIDLGTNEVLFEWHATDHYELADTYRSRGETDGGELGGPFDWFHINSVEKDAAGNYLISARYTHSLTYIDGRTGATLWILGGKRNQFQDLSQGRATTFAGQHDARWHDNGTVITLFDNGADYDTHDAEVSRGVKLHVDLSAMTAELVQEYVNPQRILSESQGSMQVLSSGNVLVGYGFVGAYTEFAPDGRALCDVHFETASGFYTGEAMSYRALKKPWKAFPQTTPDAAVVENELYVSWNGATEVRSWVVKVGPSVDAVASYEEMQRARRTGFETRIALDRSRFAGRYLRVLALDEHESVLGASEAVDLGRPQWWRRIGAAGKGYVVGPICLVGIVLVAAWLYTRRRRLNGRQDKGYMLVPTSVATNV